MTSNMVAAASCPTLAKNARMGHPVSFWETKNTVRKRLGHPPAGELVEAGSEF
jgi:hypothetical protein